MKIKKINSRNFENTSNVRTYVRVPTFIKKLSLIIYLMVFLSRSRIILCFCLKIFGFSELFQKIFSPAKKRHNVATGPSSKYFNFIFKNILFFSRKIFSLENVFIIFFIILLSSIKCNFSLKNLTLV